MNVRAITTTERSAQLRGVAARSARLGALAACAFALSACVGKQAATPAAEPETAAASAAQAATAPPTPSVVAAQAPARLPGPLSNAEALGRPGRRQLAARAAPVALTSSDGQGLELQRYFARAVVDGPLSHCELRLAFHNPERRQREGRFSLVLPPGATVARFAMKNGDSWMEGEVVEKQRARRVYEDFLHRRTDPALLEVDAGNTFSARVFPIEPDADKEIIVAWSAERSDPAASWTLPLVGLPELELLDIRVFVQSDGEALPAADRLGGLGGGLGALRDGRQEIVVRRSKIQPAVDLEVRPGVLDAGWAALRAGTIAVVRVDAGALDAAAPDGAGNEAPLGETLALFDTSASGALAYETRLRQLRALAARVAARGGHLRVVAFDQSATLVEGSGADALVDALALRGPLGATDLGAALELAARLAREASAPTRVVLLSDGMVTAGERYAPRLVAAAAALADAGVTRLDAVTATAARDDDLLGRVVTAGLPHDGVVIHAGVEADALDRLERRTLGPLQVEVEGADWVWPDRVVGLEADSSFLVWAELKASDAPLAVRVHGGAEGHFEPVARGADERLLERAWGRARIALLEREADRLPADAADALRRKAVELALRYRVLSRWTSLLVLESDADYARYGIERGERAAILTVTDEGATSLAARDEVEQAAPKTGNKDLLEALGQPTERRRARGEATDRDDAPRREARTGRDAPAEEAEAEPSRTQELGGAGRVGEAEGDDARVVAATAGPGDRAAAPRQDPEPPARRDGAVNGASGGELFAEAEDDDVGAERAPSADERADDSAPPPAASAPTSAARRPAASPEPVPRPEEPSASPRERPSRDDVRPKKTAKVRDGVGGQKGISRFGALADLSGSDASGHRPGRRYYDPLAPNVPGKVTATLHHRILRAPRVSHSALDRALLRRRAGLVYCARSTARHGPVAGHIIVEFAIDSRGVIALPSVRQLTGVNPVFGRCVATVIARLRLPATGSIGRATVRIDVSARVGRPPRPVRPPPPPSHLGERRKIERELRRKPPLRGILADVDAAIAASSKAKRRGPTQPTKGERAATREAGDDARDDDPLRLAQAFVDAHPADLLGYVALGRAYEASGAHASAARAYGSLIDLYPGRADLRRFAGNLLDAIDDAGAATLASDTYAAAVADREDHPTGWLMLAIAQARADRLIDAIRTLDAGLAAPRRAGNFPAWERTARELLGVIAAAAMPDDGKDPDQIGPILARHRVRPDRRAGMRLLLTWENDANDVDLHVFDRRDQHAYFKRKRSAGGSIFADVTTGWGPECFSTRDRNAKLRVFVHSYRQGPMGFAMGRVVALHSDGKGKLAFETRPFVIMDDRAYADLGTFSARAM